MSNNEKKSSLFSLVLGAVGIVYGDIGTSPLYALKETFNHDHGLVLTTENIMGVISLMIWALIIVVSLKYVTLILRAHNRGEGGIMAMIALASSSVSNRGMLRTALIMIGLIGAALFYGDGVITPAISVLSAVEGLELVLPESKPFVIPISIAILAALYLAQKKGTHKIAFLFGPIMVCWFILLGVLGVMNIILEPSILMAANPLYALSFFINHGALAFTVLGVIVLCVTGAEALYADLGHFGHFPIRLAWFFLAFPALVLSYLGQGALLLRDPLSVSNPFFNQVPEWGIFPLVIFATLATVIASQATISGTFSITRQAINLGYLPRFKIFHTSVTSIGQIYIPAINWIQFFFVVLAVVGFGSSSALAAAYGIAVTGTMLITTLLTFFVIRYCWHYNLLLCIAATGFFVVIDLAFFGANMLKIMKGGWYPFVAAVLVYIFMSTWFQGRILLRNQIKKQLLPLDTFLTSVMSSSLTHRVPGTAIFLRSESEGVPHSLLHNLYHNKVMHSRVVFVTVYVEEIPWISADQRIKVTSLGYNCFQIDIFFGFKNELDVPKALELCSSVGLEFNLMETSFFLSRQSVIPALKEGMALWRERLFSMMMRNAGDLVTYYNLPPNRVIEVGAQVEI